MGRWGAFWVGSRVCGNAIPRRVRVRIRGCGSPRGAWCGCPHPREPNCVRHAPLALRADGAFGSCMADGNRSISPAGACAVFVSVSHQRQPERGRCSGSGVGAREGVEFRRIYILFVFGSAADRRLPPLFSSHRTAPCPSSSLPSPLPTFAGPAVRHRPPTASGPTHARTVYLRSPADELTHGYTTSPTAMTIAQFHGCAVLAAPRSWATQDLRANRAPGAEAGKDVRRRRERCAPCFLAVFSPIPHLCASRSPTLGRCMRICRADFRSPSMYSRPSPNRSPTNRAVARHRPRDRAASACSLVQRGWEHPRAPPASWEQQCTRIASPREFAITSAKQRGRRDSDGRGRSSGIRAEFPTEPILFYVREFSAAGR